MLVFDIWKVADGPVFKRHQSVFEPSTRYTLRPPFTAAANFAARSARSRIAATARRDRVRSSANHKPLKSRR